MKNLSTFLWPHRKHESILRDWKTETLIYWDIKHFEHGFYSESNPIDWLDFRRWWRSFEDDPWLELFSFVALLLFGDSALFTTMRGLNNLLLPFVFAFKPHVWFKLDLSLWTGRLAAQINGKIESRIPSVMTSFNFSLSAVSSGDFSLKLWRLLKRHFWLKLFPSGI